MGGGAAVSAEAAALWSRPPAAFPPFHWGAELPFSGAAQPLPGARPALPSPPLHRSDQCNRERKLRGEKTLPQCISQPSIPNSFSPIGCSAVSCPSRDRRASCVRSRGTTVPKRSPGAATPREPPGDPPRDQKHQEMASLSVLSGFSAFSAEFGPFLRAFWASPGSGVHQAQHGRLVALVTVTSGAASYALSGHVLPRWRRPRRARRGLSRFSASWPSAGGAAPGPGSCGCRTGPCRAPCSCPWAPAAPPRA